MVILILNSINSFAQQILFLSSENSYVTIVGKDNWYAEDTSDFTGIYEFINAAEDENGNPNGDGWLDKLYIEFTQWDEESLGFGIFGYTVGEVEGWDEPMLDTLKNSKIECEGEMLIASSCSLVSDNMNGEFSKLKYKDKSGKLKDTKGLMITRSDNNGYSYFYEKVGNDNINQSEKIINVMGYDSKISINCIVDYLESDPFEYIGAFQFTHNGTSTYVLSTLDYNKLIFNSYFESLTYSDSTKFDNIRFENNWIYAVDSNGNSFRARFVKTKCKANDGNWEGYIGLLIDEELLYIMQGD